MDLRYLIIPLASLPILLLAFLLAMRAWRGIRQVRRVRGWLRVPGRVISSEVRETTVTVRREIGIMQDRDALRYFAHVVYEYNVAGTRHENERIRLGAVVLTSEPEPAARAAARYPLGSRVSVYSNPADPAESVLDPRIGWEAVIYGLITLVLLLSAVLVILLFSNLPPQIF
jgi:hypothetical protein